MTAGTGSLRLIARGPEETARIGRILGGELRAGDVVALTGELGAGKTCLTQGIALGLGVPPEYAVTSPTFTLINEYPGSSATLFHLDLYRIGGSAELDEIGFDECLDRGGVVVVEWADRIPEAMPAEAIRITIGHLEGDLRTMELFAAAERIGRWERLLTEGGS